MLGSLKCWSLLAYFSLGLKVIKEYSYKRLCWQKGNRGNWRQAGTIFFYYYFFLPAQLQSERDLWTSLKAPQLLSRVMVVWSSPANSDSCYCTRETVGEEAIMCLAGDPLIFPLPGLPWNHLVLPEQRLCVIFTVQGPSKNSNIETNFMKCLFMKKLHI